MLGLVAQSEEHPSRTGETLGSNPSRSMMEFQIEDFRLKIARTLSEKLFFNLQSSICNLQ